MTLSGPGGRRSRQRIVVVSLVFALLALAGFANASIKRHRASTGSAPSATLSEAVTGGGAISTAWYCAGPLPLGLRTEHSLIAIGNVSKRALDGELVVATETGASRSEALTIGPRSSVSVTLGRAEGPAFGSATVLLDGTGAGVTEVVVGPTGTDEVPCVSHAGFTQYIAGGATKGTSTIDLAVFDPGATPSVVSVAMATSSGVVSPPAFQEVPVQAGETLVFDVARYLPLQTVLGTTITATGGRVVAGALSSAAAGHVSFPSLVSATAAPETAWYFPPGPSGPGDVQAYVVLNPSQSAARLTLTLTGAGGRAVLDALVPSAGVVELPAAADRTAGALRAATLTSTAPVVVSRQTVLGPFAPGKAASRNARNASRTTQKTTTKPTLNKTGKKTATTTTTTTTTTTIAAPAPSSGAPPTVSGFSTTAASAVLDDTWLLEGGECDAAAGEFVAISNPGDKPATVRFDWLAGGGTTPVATVPAGSSAAVDLGTGTDPPGSVSIEVQASEPVVVGAGVYARGSNGSLGFSAPVAIPVD